MDMEFAKKRGLYGVTWKFTFLLSVPLRASPGPCPSGVSAEGRLAAELIATSRNNYGPGK